MIYKKIEVINNLLSDSEIPTEHHNPWAFCVHACIMPKWKKVMCRLVSKGDWEMCEQKLQIGTKFYDMRLIIVALPTGKNVNFIARSISNSQFSFPWEDNPTLFINIGSFNIMQKFIRKHNLEAHILKIEELTGITANNEIIKVVSFRENVSEKLDLINEYKKCKGICATKYYFMTSAFPWQQSYWLKKLHVNTEIYSILPIILHHLETISYINDLNIFDLLSLRWALSNVHDPIQSNYLNYEIDYKIKRELRKIVRNNHLDLDQYLIAKNSKQIELLFFYLVYEFQEFFKTVYISRYPILPRLETFKVFGTVKLSEEINVLNLLKEKSNVEYKVDGRGFNKMSLPLFLDLVECHNVVEIILDANFAWLNKRELDRCTRIYQNGDEIYVRLIGENSYNFVEDFVAALKTTTISNNKIYLAIYCDLKEYSIFDNLTISKIKFQNIKINQNMLRGLHQCNIKAGSILLYDCAFENTPDNWELLNKLRKLHYATIDEDEGTWQSLFEFIFYEIHRSNSKEFQLNDKIRYFVVNSENKKIDLRTIKFTIDKQYSKLEIRYTSNGQIIDLYDLKFLVPPDDTEYEYYT